MSDSELSNYECSLVVNLLIYLQNAGCYRLADRLDRTFGYFKQGLINRDMFYNGVLREAAFRGISLACKDRNAKFVSDFADLLDDIE